MNAVSPTLTHPWPIAPGATVLDWPAPEIRGLPLDYDTILEPSIFWFWNGDANHESIQRRLDDFLEKGIRAVHVHPMPDYFRPAHFQQGMPIPYLSDQFFELIAFTCEQMRQRQMLLWLYDEGGWPSGVAGGSVVATDVNYGLWALQQQGERIVPIQPFMKEAYPDLMNPAATRCFIENTHEKYRQYIGSEFGKTVQGIFTDEPRLPGRLGTDLIPWSPLVPAAYARQHGHAVDEILSTLFLPDTARDEETSLMRRNYMSTVSGLIAENYYKVIRQWCERWGLLFEGHHSGEDEFGNHGQYFGDFMEQARNYHIPGVDAIWRQIFPEQNSGNYASLASSISWLRGQRCALSESFNVYGPGLTLEQMYWVSAFQIVRGVNKIAFMPSLDETSEVRWMGMGTDISPKTPVWRDFDLVVDFVRKAARFSASGQARAAIGMFYRSELVAENHQADFDARHEAICSHIHDFMAGMVFVGTKDLQNGTYEDGRLKIGPIELSALVVHTDGALTDADERVILNLAEQGLQVWRVSDDSGPSDAINRVSDFNSIDLSEHSPLIFNCQLKGVRLLTLDEDGQTSLLFFNENLRPVEFSFHFRDAASSLSLTEVPLEDLLANTSQPVVSTGQQHTLHLRPGQMRAFQFASELAAEEVPYWKIDSSQPLDLDWRIVEEERYVIGDDVHIETEFGTEKPGRLGDYSEIQPDFSGSLCYHAKFDLAHSSAERLVLDLGEVFYSAEVFLNGQSCGRRAWGPYLFDITSALRAGANDLTVRVTNTLANQWAREDTDAQSSRADGNPYLERTSAFVSESLHAGLVGPVTLQFLGE